jgi:flagellar L-ring protein precursor FlgH
VAKAQSGSLFRKDVPTTNRPLTLADTSFTYRAAEPPRTLKLNDIVTVIVLEKSQVTSEADLERRKTASLAAELKDWVELDGLSLKKAPQASGDPKVSGTLNGQVRAEADLETKDLMKFSIAARVVDIRPNGHLVLEAHQKFTINEEQWERSLSGIVRPDDVKPDNTVLSEDVAELMIDKRERGIVRDGYRRGWLFKWLDKYRAF